MSSSETDLAQGGPGREMQAGSPRGTSNSSHTFFSLCSAGDRPGVPGANVPGRQQARVQTRTTVSRNSPVPCASVTEILKLNIYTQVKSVGWVNYFHIYLDHVSLMF